MTKFCPLRLCEAMVVEGQDGSTALCCRGDSVCTAEKTGLNTVCGVLDKKGLWLSKTVVMVVGVGELIVVFCSVRSVVEWVVGNCLASFVGLSCEDGLFVFVGVLCVRDLLG